MKFPRNRYVSRGSGVSYGLEYPYQYKQAAATNKKARLAYLIFNYHTGQVYAEITWHDFIYPTGERLKARPQDYDQERLWAELAAQNECRKVNGLGGHDPSINALHDMEA